MILLTAHSLTPRGRFGVETCGLTLEERNSQIQFTLPVGEAELTTGDWIRDDTDPGAGIVYRIRTVETNYQTRTVSCTAEHIIKVLGDTAIFGEVKPSDMGGTETSVSALAAIKNAINRQSDWVLNEQGFGYGSVSAGYTFNGDSVYEAIETVCSTLEDCWWSYDVSVYPFVLTIAHKATTATCEMRGGRNISSIRRTVDRSRMYTRIYPIGKENLHITGNYLSKNTNIYGVICKVETDQSIESEDHLRMWAQGRLNRHCEPSVNISINGLELSQETGEPLDHLTVGTVCRVPLPEFGTTLNETITKLQWRDKIKEPENVSVTLANEMEDVASIIRQEQSSGSGLTGRGGRAGAKKAGEDHAWFVDTDDHVSMVAEAIGGFDEDGNPNWSRVSEATVDGDGIHQRVTYAEGEIVTHESRITQTESDITQEVTDRSSADGTLSSAISQNATQIALKVNAGDVATQLAVECNNVSITGGNLTVDGYILATGLSTAIANMGTVSVSGLTATGNISAGGSVIGSGVYVGSAAPYTDLSSSISALQIQLSGNTYTLQYKKHNTADWQSVAQTFSRAVASWTLGWSGGTFTAKANPQNQSATTVISQGTPEWEGTACTIPINGTDSTSPNVTYATGITAYVDAASKLEEISVSGVYAGQELTPSGEGKIGFSKVTIGALTEYHLSEQWGSGNESNKLVISRSSTGSDSLTHTITAEAGISFSSNKFTASAKAKVDNAEKDNDSESTGTLSLAFNSLQGSGASAYRTISLKEGSTVRMTSGNLTDYGDGYSAGYGAGWNAAVALITRDGNTIKGPKKDKALAASDRTETKFTATYVASSYSYTGSSYTASSNDYSPSSYHKETHAYVASSSSFTQATCKTNGTNHTKYYYNSNFKGSVEYNPASYSYTPSSHSYSQSSYSASSDSYTPSSYTPESVSYTPSSLTWS